MKTFFLIVCFLTLCLASFASAQAPTNELAFQLGGLVKVSHTNLDLGPGVALQVNYGRRFFSVPQAAVYGEIHFLANPQRSVSSILATPTRDIASLYITPGVRVKFAPAAKISPYLAAGVGYADYQQSTLRLDGFPNPASRDVSRAAFHFAGGVDYRLIRWLALRGEVRDFYTGVPDYNDKTITGRQQNVVVSAAFVLRFP